MKCGKTVIVVFYFIMSYVIRLMITLCCILLMSTCARCIRAVASCAGCTTKRCIFAVDQKMFVAISVRNYFCGKKVDIFDIPVTEHALHLVYTISVQQLPSYYYWDVVNLSNFCHSQMVVTSNSAGQKYLRSTVAVQKPQHKSPAPLMRAVSNLPS